MSENPVTLRIYLKGGQSFDLKVMHWSLSRGAVEGEIRKFTWAEVDEMLAYINLSEIAAIVELGS